MGGDYYDIDFCGWFVKLILGFKLLWLYRLILVEYFYYYFIIEVVIFFVFFIIVLFKGLMSNVFSFVMR